LKSYFSSYKGYSLAKYIATESMPQRGFQKRKPRILVVMIIKEKRGFCGNVSTFLLFAQIVKI